MRPGRVRFERLPACYTGRVMPKYFTLDEASALLPTLRPILEQIISCAHGWSAPSATWSASTGRPGPTATPSTRAPSARDSRPATALMAEINAELVKIHELGVELKDPAVGLIDFPSLRDDRVVYLCWRLGETAIEYWHETNTGFAGRQPLLRRRPSPHPSPGGEGASADARRD